jgi:hypothetical protein
MSNKRKHGGNPTDEQFEYDPVDWNWKTNKHQKVLGKELVVIQPNKKVELVPSGILEFDVKTEDVVSFTPNTRFHIEGQFEYKELPADTQWIPCTAAEYAKVIVQPNWVDNLIKRVDVYNGGQLIVTNDEGHFVAPYINTFLYAYMDKHQKRLLCPEPCSPGNGVPTKTGAEGWDKAAGSEWQAYSKKIFTGENISFGHLFMQQFPFWQHSNYFERMPKILPSNAMLRINVLFNDYPDAIFKQVGTNVRLYRFAFKKFELWTEQLRVNPSVKASMLKEKRVQHFSGVCRMLRSESIASTLTIYRHSVQDVFFPEGVLLYTLPKDVLAGSYKYKNNADGNVLSANKITNVAIQFGDQTYFFNHPNIGDVKDASRELNTLVDYFAKPPFGMKMDPEKITLAALEDGFKNTPYPHVYLNLCNFADISRVVPFLDKDATIVGKRNKLDIIMTFETGGAVNDVTYFAHLFYTDYNTAFDPKTKQFTTPYIKYTNQAV